MAVGSSLSLLYYAAAPGGNLDNCHAESRGSKKSGDWGEGEGGAQKLRFLLSEQHEIWMSQWKSRECNGNSEALQADGVIRGLPI